MYSRIFFFTIFLILLSTPSVHADANIQVEIIGIKGRLLENVQARLRIKRFGETSALSASEIKRLHSLAEKDIRSAVAPYGYYGPEIASSLESDEQGWYARYEVTLGDPIMVDSVSITTEGEGHEVKALSNPLRYFGIEPGDQLNQPKYERGKKALLQQAIALGFLDAEYRVHEIAIDRVKKSAAITVIFDTRNRYYFGETSSSQKVIKNKLLSNYLSYQPGEYYDVSKLHQVQRDLYKTNYFDNVQLTGDKTRAENFLVPIIIELDPVEKFNRYSFGVGYDTDTGARAIFEWSNKLLNSRGHWMDASLILGDLESSSTVNYNIPIRDPRYESFHITGLSSRQRWKGTKTAKGLVGGSYEYYTERDRYSLSLELADEDYLIGSQEDRSLLLIPGISASWVFADQVINTENGFRASVSVSGAAEEVVSDATFLKIQADARAILSPIEKWRIIGRASVGTIVVDTIDDLPPTQRFYAGGSNSVRGYRYRTLGAKDSNGTVIGGRHLLTGSIELERSVSQYLRTVAFYDVGNAMDDPKVDVVQGVGFGLGVALPFGQIRVELAYPLDDEGSAQYFYLTVGADL